MRIKLSTSNIIPMKEVPARFYDPERDGVTFTLLNTFKTCREKARLVLKGWTSRKSSLGQVFGGLVHGVNQRIYEDIRDGFIVDIKNGVPSEEYIRTVCKHVEKTWRKENPKADDESLKYLEFSMILLEALMPEYFKYWKKDFKLIWEKVEAEFKWPITIDHPKATATKTFLRGKLDGSFTRKPNGRPTLFETKTKAQMSEYDEADLADILPHELQVNIYLLYLWWVDSRVPEGLLYNIIRRPALRQKKKESLVQFAKRVASDVRLRPEYYFVRMQMLVEKKDLEKNELEIRDLVSDFLMWWNGLAGHYKNSDACRNKYGTCGMLPICSRGDYTGLYRREKVFRELADEL